ncbi:MAG TPA: YfhO family protein, partial [Candidatus Saccharimonadales bacterium]|nr:YfhO family protein [Candidatus Saccharimonadales bacterium]
KDDPKAYLLSQNGFKLVWSQDGWQIYENENAMERAFLVFNARSYGSNEEFADKFYSSTFNPQKTILLNNAQTGFSTGRGSAEIQTYAPNNITITTKSNAKALLFLSDSYFPGWKAYVDGKPTQVLKADFTFRAVEVPSGVHRVRFVYQPSSFSLGLTLAIISLVLTLGGAVIVTRRKL